MRSRVVALAMVAALGACGDADPTSSGAPVATSTTPAQTVTTQIPEAPTGSAVPSEASAGSVPDEHLGADLRVVVADGSGVRVVEGDAESRVAGAAQPAAVAFGVGTTTVWQPDVAQTADVEAGPSSEVLVTRSGVTEQLIAVELDIERLRLLDVGTTNRGPVAVVAHWRLNWPDTPSESAWVIQVDTGERIELPEFVGRRPGYLDAQVLDDGVVVVTATNRRPELTRYDLTGVAAWTVETDAGITLVPHPGDVIGIVATRIGGQDFTPALTLTTFGDDGTETGADTLTLAPRSITMSGGFCAVAERVGARLVCDRSDGGPVVIDLDSGVTDELAPGGGIATIAR